jgi:hypothetical protein
VNDYAHPKRLPPPLGCTSRGKDGVTRPVMEAPFMECGQCANLRGVGWVECIRRKGHPLSLFVAHSNGLGDEWCFDEAEIREGLGL